MSEANPTSPDPERDSEVASSTDSEPVPQVDLDAIESDLDLIERSLDQLAAGTYWERGSRDHPESPEPSESRGRSESASADR